MATDDPHTPDSASRQTAADLVSERGGKTPSADGSERARDLVKTGGLTERSRLGERLLRRVGGRMWDRPNLAVSARLYKRFQLDDPWAPPGTSKRRSAIGLGPVSLRFGEKRRQPAPHLKPKQPKKKKMLAAEDPVAKYRRPKPTPQSQPTPAPKPAAAKPPTPSPSSAARGAAAGPTGKYAVTGSSGEFGRTEKHGLVGKLPVRPDLKRDDGASGGPSRGAATRGKRPATPAAPPPSQPSMPVRPPPPKAATGPKSSSRPQPRQRKPSPGGGAGGGGVPLPRPKLPTPKKRRAGRFRMSPTEVRSPIVKKIVAPEPVVRHSDNTAATLDPAPPVKKKKVAPEKPIDRSIPTGPMGLNDLFGAMDGGRMRVGRRKKEREEEPETE